MRIRAAVLRQMGLPMPYGQSRPLSVEEVDLAGPGAGELAISGGYLYRILDISPTVAVTITDLALTEVHTTLAPDG